MRIKGTGKAELLVGTAASDIIDGGAGNDTINSGSGFDTVTGGRGADTFVFDSHTQYVTITDFNAAEGDRIVFSSDGSTAAATSLSSAALYDGMSFEASGGTCHVGCVDVNGDGIMDTQFSMNGANMFVLGCTPDMLHGSDILG
jgi:Ca2+-binding RTX toxin-like protein